MRPPTAVALLLPALLTLSGCGPELELTQQQSRVIAAADPDEVLLAAARILRREFGAVQIDRAARTVETKPVEFVTTRESGTTRDLYRGRSTMRKSARLSVGRRAEAVITRLRIDIERQDTARALTMQPPTRRVSDSPAYTPIERDAATTERQNTVWTRVRRDRRLERVLLEELHNEFSPAGEQAADAAAAGQAGEAPAGGTP